MACIPADLKIPTAVACLKCGGHVTAHLRKLGDACTVPSFAGLAAFKAIRAKLRKGEIKLAQGKVAPPGALPKQMPAQAQPAAAAAAAAGGAAAEKAKPAEIKKEKK